MTQRGTDMGFGGSVRLSWPQLGMPGYDAGPAVTKESAHSSDDTGARVLLYFKPTESWGVPQSQGDVASHHQCPCPAL